MRALSEYHLASQGLTVSNSHGKIKTDWALAGVDKSSGEETHAKINMLTTDKGTIKTGAGWNYNVGKAAVGSDIAVLRKLQQVQNRELRQQTIQAINNSEARHNAFANWVKINLGKKGASQRYISAGFVTTDIAQQIQKYSGNEKVSELILVMSEKRLAHANNSKHHKDGIGLTADEYASISRIIASPSMVIWDKDNQNLIYLNQDKTIKVVVDAPSKDKLKPRDRVDAIINAYKVDFKKVEEAIKGGIYLILKQK